MTRDEIPEDACGTCNGEGRVYQNAHYSTCPACRGTGYDEPEPEERRMTMDKALDLDQQKLDALMSAEPGDDDTFEPVLP